MTFSFLACHDLGILFASSATHHRWLVKKHRDEQALKILTRIYMEKGRAQTQLEEIQSTVNTKREAFSQTFKYVLQWKVLKR